MFNIVKLYYNKNYDKINEYILHNPNIFNNKVYIYIRAMTEYRLKLYENSYISFHKLLNKYDLDDIQLNVNKKISIKCLKKINNNRIKIDYDNKYIDLSNNFSWIINGLFCTTAYKLNNDYIKAINFYNIKYIISLSPYTNLINTCLLKNSDIVHIYYDINVDTPVIEQINKIIYLIKKYNLNNDGVLINCINDPYILDTILSCYFLQYNDYPQLSYTDAINKIKNFNSKSVIKSSHNTFIKNYSDIIWDKYCIG